MIYLFLQTDLEVSLSIDFLDSYRSSAIINSGPFRINSGDIRVNQHTAVLLDLTRIEITVPVQVKILCSPSLLALIPAVMNATGFFLLIQAILRVIFRFLSVNID